MAIVSFTLSVSVGGAGVGGGAGGVGDFYPTYPNGLTFPVLVRLLLLLLFFAAGGREPELTSQRSWVLRLLVLFPLESNINTRILLISGPGLMLST